MNLKGIDKCYSREDILSEMEKHNAEFNLDNFYLEDTFDGAPGFTGFMVITSDMKYSGFCHPYSSYHDSVMESVLFGLYGDEYNEMYREKKGDIRKICEGLGVVYVQMLSQFYTLLWIPDKINEFQCEAILEYLDQMDEINSKLDSPIILGIDINDKAVKVKDVRGILPSMVSGKRRV